MSVIINYLFISSEVLPKLTFTNPRSVTLTQPSSLISTAFVNSDEVSSGNPLSTLMKSSKSIIPSPRSPSKVSFISPGMRMTFFIEIALLVIVISVLYVR